MSQILEFLDPQSPTNHNQSIQWDVQQLDPKRIVAVTKNLIKPQITAIMANLNENLQVTITQCEMEGLNTLIYRGSVLSFNSGLSQWLSKFRVHTSWCEFEIYTFDTNGEEILLYRIEYPLEELYWGITKS